MFCFFIFLSFKSLQFSLFQGLQQNTTLKPTKTENTSRVSAKPPFKIFTATEEVQDWTSRSEEASLQPFQDYTVTKSFATPTKESTASVSPSHPHAPTQWECAGCLRLSPRLAHSRALCSVPRGTGITQINTPTLTRSTAHYNNTQTNTHLKAHTFTCVTHCPLLCETHTHTHTHTSVHGCISAPVRLPSRFCTTHASTRPQLCLQKTNPADELRDGGQMPDFCIFYCYIWLFSTLCTICHDI